MFKQFIWMERLTFIVDLLLP